MKHILIFSLFHLSIQAQNPKYLPLHDGQWLFGYSSFTSDSNFGGSRMLFSTPDPEIINDDRSIDFYVTNASICDSSGALLFYTNGYCVANANNDTMLGGSKINPDSSFFQDANNQGALILPIPQQQKKYIIIHSLSTLYPTAYAYHQIYNCLFTVVDMNLDQGLGMVIEANQSFLKDTLCFGKLTACKHANGRDWWILIPKWNSSAYFMFLLTPEGMELRGKQQLGSKPISGAGQAVFSPDGTKYVRYNSVGTEIGGFLDIFDFDRCTGQLSNPVNLHLTSQVGMPGVAISPNSRYLYVANGLWLHQYDLAATNVAASKVLIGTYDGFKSPGPTYFFMLQLAPNGKLYMNSAGSVNTLHVIHSPDLPGNACRFEQHGVQLPARNDWSMPNFPNFRLGPLDGSPCDTLGLDNLPVAHFRWEFWDTLSPLRVFFTNLSIYEPQNWQWDFGDSAESIEKDPEHVYQSPGVYTVCLRVQNDYGADTICYDVVVGITSDLEVTRTPLEVSTVPNPFRSVLNFSVPVASWARVDAVLYDLAGNLVATKAWRGAHSDWDLQGLPNSVYLYELIAEDGRRTAGQVVKW